MQRWPEAGIGFQEAQSTWHGVPVPPWSSLIQEHTLPFPPRASPCHSLSQECPLQLTSFLNPQGSILMMTVPQTSPAFPRMCHSPLPPASTPHHPPSSLQSADPFPLPAKDCLLSTTWPGLEEVSGNVCEIECRLL